jgi:hypothetical protein
VCRKYCIFNYPSSLKSIIAARFSSIRADPCRLSGPETEILSPLKIVGSCTHTVTNEEKMGRYTFDLIHYRNISNSVITGIILSSKLLLGLWLQKSADIKHDTDRKIIKGRQMYIFT